MSNGGYEFLREYDDGQRWVWLAARLEAIDRRIVAVEVEGGEHRCRLEEIERRCASRAWTQPAVTWLLLALAGALAGSAGWALGHVLAG